MKEWFRNADFSVVWTGRTVVEQDWDRWRYHADPFHRLYFIFSGEGRGVLEGAAVRLRAGHYYLFPAEMRLILFPPSKRLDHIRIHFHWRVMGGLNNFHWFFSRLIVFFFKPTLP